MSAFENKLNTKNCVNSAGNSTHYFYEMSGFAEKLNIQNIINSAGNCVHYICTERLDLQGS